LEDMLSPRKNNIKNFLYGLKQRISKNPRPALNDIDKKLSRYINYRNGFFIEAGANDGYAQSNTYYLEKKLGWRGVLVEAIPELYQKCLRERPNSRVYNCGLVSRSYGEPALTMHYANLMSVAQGGLKTEEAQEEHIKNGLKIQNLDRTYQIEVPARTLGSILDEQDDLPDIDLFSLDVEGFELEVLKGLNIEKYRPRYILVEARFFDEVNGFLKDRYDLVDRFSAHDCLYRSKTAGDNVPAAL